MKTDKTYEITYLNDNALGAFNERAEKVVSTWCGATKNAEGKATVSVYGALYPADYDMLTAQLEELKNDEDVKSIVLHINSPGGAVAGLFDCCDYIKSMGKPITAYISGMACSAAYAIATSCDKVYAQQDSETGCCGCYAHVMEPDYSKFGFFSRVFRSKNAPRKNVSCITDEKEAELFQASVDQHGDKYLAYVAANRGVDVETAEKTFGQGASVSAMYALANGMIDGIRSIEELGDTEAEPDGGEEPARKEPEDGCKPKKKCETTSSSQTESEGEDTDMDISAMSAEQQKELFSQLCEANPSLLNERVEEAKRVEDERVSGLNALRNGSEAVDRIVDAAVESGRSAGDIALDVVKAMKDNPAPSTAEKNKGVLEELASGTTDVGAPRAADINPYVAAAEELNGKEE